jgi:hypothetical protein
MDEEEIRKTLKFVNSEEQNNKWNKYSHERFCFRGEGSTPEKFTPTPEQLEASEKHFKELEKEWGVKFKHYPIPGGL